MKKKVAKLVIAESHARLDAARVPSCHGACCTDPTCHTRLGHRIKVLAADRDALQRSLRDVVALLATMLDDRPLPIGQRDVVARAERLLEEPTQ